MSDINLATSGTDGLVTAISEDATDEDDLDDADSHPEFRETSVEDKQQACSLWNNSDFDTVPTPEELEDTCALRHYVGAALHIQASQLADDGEADGTSVPPAYDPSSAEPLPHRDGARKSVGPPPIGRNPNVPINIDNH